MDFELESGIDSFSLYYALTPHQKAEVVKKLQKMPGFRTEISSYIEDTYLYPESVKLK